MAQESTFKKFMKMHCPEKMWVITHPFVAKKAWAITQHARQLASEMINDPDLDGDYSGGQIDAFRHGYWMASLSQKIGKQRAYKLGVAHEKGNRIDYEKRKNEEGILPDSVSCEMDLRNNKVGIQIGHENKNAAPVELQLLIKQAILEGLFWKIKKTTDGRFLDANRNVLSEEDWKGKWTNPKTLVPSTYRME